MSKPCSETLIGKQVEAEDLSTFIIQCIEVLKVFDFCFQQDFRFQCFPVPQECAPPLPAGATAACDIVSADCFEVRREPAPPPAPPGVVVVVLRIEITANITIFNPDTTIRCVFTVNFSFEKPILLFVPDGADVVCEILAACGPCTVDTLVCCKFEFCILVQSRALAKLLVPTLGFCPPRECQPLPQPFPFPCPPPPPFEPTAKKP
ncbi:MAG: hypothetical protein AB1445_11710 [Bacillota bacterium]